MGLERGKVFFGAALVVVAVSVGATIGHVTRGPVPSSPPPAGDEPAPPVDEQVIRVHVSGMVMAPGVVDVAANAIVADAIEAAGGLRAGALVDQINLAAPVSGGDQILVPGPDTRLNDPGGSFEDGVISLNRATAVELEALPGVGPVLAERIVAFRDQNGGFEAVEDLLEVPGIGEAKLAAMRDMVRP